MKIKPKLFIKKGILENIEILQIYLLFQGLKLIGAITVGD